jgi:hypothetical protein
MKPTVGRLVHYVMPNGRSAGDVRPALIVRVWDGPGDALPPGEAVPLVQLQVFTDGMNDGEEWATGLVWKTSVHYSEANTPGTWHWPPRL